MTRSSGAVLSLLFLSSSVRYYVFRNLKLLLYLVLFSERVVVQVLIDVNSSRLSGLLGDYLLVGTPNVSHVRRF